ncbi:MAG: hypothetical protein AAB295_04305, partial [Chloroflexota bacterium]
MAEKVTPGRERTAVLDRDGLAALIAELMRREFEVIGPRVRDGAIVYDTVRSLADLPESVTDEQGPGHYRLARREDRLRALAAECGGS